MNAPSNDGDPPQRMGEHPEHDGNIESAPRHREERPAGGHARRDDVVEQRHGRRVPPGPAAALPRGETAQRPVSPFGGSKNRLFVRMSGSDTAREVGALHGHGHGHPVAPAIRLHDRLSHPVADLHDRHLVLCRLPELSVVAHGQAGLPRPDAILDAPLCPGLRHGRHHRRRPELRDRRQLVRLRPCGEQRPEPALYVRGADGVLP